MFEENAEPTDLETSAQPDMPGTDEGVDLHEFLEAAGVKPDWIGECVQCIEAWKDGDYSKMEAFLADKKGGGYEEEPAEEEPLDFSGMNLMGAAKKAEAKARSEFGE